MLYQRHTEHSAGTRVAPCTFNYFFDLRLKSIPFLVASAFAFATSTGYAQTNLSEQEQDEASKKSKSTPPQVEHQLPGVTVHAAIPESATEGSGSYTTGSMTTATGLNLSIRDTPQSVSVVTRERIDDQRMTTAADALRNTIGISVKPVDRGRNSVSARGFDVNNFQFDGVPMATGNIGIETANTAMYDHIEVVRGATGLLSGAGDPSASVNLIRKHADSKVLTGSFNAELGSWDQRAGTLDITTPLNSDGSVRARFVARQSKQDAFIDLENSENSLFYGILDADLTPDTHLSFGYSEQRDKRNGVLWAGLPYWYSDGTRTNWSRSKTTAPKWNQWDTKEQTAFATLEHKLPSQWVLRGDISHRRQKEDQKSLWLDSESFPDPSTGVIGAGAVSAYHYVTDPRQTQISLSATGPFELFGRNHELTVGFIRSRLTDGWSNRDPLSTFGSVNLNNWDGSYPEPEWGPRYKASEGTTDQTAVYSAARIQLTDRFKAIVGGRLSNWKRTEEQAAWTSEAYEIKHDNVFTPYAGLIYDLTEKISAYASYTDMFKPQTNRDRNGSYLDPLEGKSYELGLKGEFFNGKLNASAAVFETKQDNFAVPDPGFLVPGTATPASRTTQGVKVKGYEMEVSGEVALGWDVGAGFTQFSARDADGVDVAVDHSRKQFKFFTKYELQGDLQGLSVGGGVVWEDGRPATDTNPATGAEEKVGQPAYALFDFMTRYQIDPRWSVQLNIYNLFDKKYRSGSAWWGSPYTYGEPRKVLLTTNFSF